MKTRSGLIVILSCLLFIPLLTQAFTASAGQRDDEPVAETRWEHLALPYPAKLDTELSKKINKLGDDGWQLVCVTATDRDGTTDRTIYYFKRPK